MNRTVAAIANLLFITISIFASAQRQQFSDERYLDHLFDRAVLFDTTRTSAVGVVADTAELWKHWSIIENFHFGKNRGALPMITDLQALHPYFRDKVIELMRLCREDGITLAVVETYRTPSKQAEYFAMGKMYTSTSGGQSRHQYGLAVDIVPIVDSVAVWDNHKLWRRIGTAGERLGLRWGGRWKVLYDPGHFEWPGGVSRYELAKGKLPPIPSKQSERYPAIEQDLERLRRFWQAWEIEQSVVADNKKSEKNSSAGTSQ